MGCRRRAVASPTTPDESTSAGSTSAGRPRTSSTRSLQALPSTSSKPVTAAFVWSVTCRAPSDRVHASHVSTVPKHRSRSRAPSTWSSNQASLVADWFGASARSCSTRATMHSPTVRRSCQPSAGAIGSPVARSHTIVLARWLVMPTTSIGPADAVASAAASSTVRASSAASNSTRPGNGVDGGNGRRAMATICSPSSTIAARTLVVPTSRTRITVTARPWQDAPAAQPLAEQPAHETGGEDDGEVEGDGKPSHVEAAQPGGSPRRRLGRRGTCRSPSPGRG